MFSPGFKCIGNVWEKVKKSVLTHIVVVLLLLLFKLREYVERIKYATNGRRERAGVKSGKEEEIDRGLI